MKKSVADLPGQTEAGELRGEDPEGLRVLRPHRQEDIRRTRGTLATASSRSAPEDSERCPRKAPKMKPAYPTLGKAAKWLRNWEDSMRPGRIFRAPSPHKC